MLEQKVAGMALDMHLLVKEYFYVDMDINLFTLLLKAVQLHFIEYKEWGAIPTLNLCKLQRPAIPMPTAWNCICGSHESSHFVSVTTVHSSTVKPKNIKFFTIFFSYKKQTPFVIFCICYPCKEYSVIDINKVIYGAFVYFSPTFNSQ